MADRRLSITLISLLLALGLAWNQPVLASLPNGNAVTDPASILRDALPVDQPDLEQLQHRIEGTSTDLRANRWSALSKTMSSSQFLLSSRKDRILNAIPESNRSEADGLLNSVKEGLEALQEKAGEKNKNDFLVLRQETLNQVGNVQALLLTDFPFEIPSEYNDLPRLLGRATVLIKTTQGNMTAIIDGFNAPLTSGAFVDLALKGFYNGLPFTRAEDFFVLQSGDPKGPEVGYIDRKSGQERHVPLEIRVPGETVPFYNETFEDLGIYKATPVLPFATLGTLGWAHSDQALDDGSSQFFMFLYDAELTPAGLNLVDGRNAAFGYVVEGNELLEKLGVEDRIETIKVIDGADRLQAHA
ncbi:MAG: peptidylprolyl isomerase [Prochlorococcus sp.]|nr:peptidylprolyl isomerase [Prochlorococcus sp.]MDP6193416.1 peptidylprolyl isomerase [Prochlorococcaceae cyanobacterium ETNP18_MAG_1]CAI8172363.1 MAG: Putative bifunctional phosphatase/peptidyl-prolyl cis-trans isomerase [Prochlorococcus marinus str. MIT 9215]